MKRLFQGLFLLFLLLGCAAAAAVYITPPPPQPPQLPPPPETGAVSASVIDGKSGIIYGEKQGDLRIYPASTTKILTCILALEEGRDKLDTDAVITPLAMGQDGTDLGIRPDVPLSLHELLYGMMLVSGNDAAVSVAETVGGSYSRFVEMMNEKAAAAGALYSHFANPNGLTDPLHYTTANDMARIAAYAMKNPEFRAIVKEPVHKMVYRSGMYRVVENRNEFLTGGYAGANGIKTGMTEAAGDCLVASAERDGVLMIAAVYNDDNRWKDVEKWLDYGFAAEALQRQYEEALAAEPPFYKWVNRQLGRE